MSEDAIRTAIYNTVNGISLIGKVYDYERWSKDWSAFLTLFKATINGEDQIRGWEICRRSAKEEKITLGMGGSDENEIAHVFVIRGYMGLKDSDATEKTFNLLIEAMATAFRANLSLSGTAQEHGSLQREVIETRSFGNVLCHYAELTLSVVERI